MGSCVPLTGTTQCPSFAAFSIYSNKQLDGVAGFDAYMLESLDARPGTPFGNYVRSPEGLGCTGWDGTGLRYLHSSLCASFVGLANMAEPPCVSPPATPPLCARTLATFVASLNAIRSNATACPGGGVAAAFESYASTFSVVAPFLADTASCLSIETFDTQNCGFLSTAEAVAHCATSSDTCCTTVVGAKANATSSATLSATKSATAVLIPTLARSTSAAASSTTAGSSPQSSSDSNSTTLSIPMIAGIGGGAGLLIIAAITICCCRKSRPSSSNGIPKEYHPMESPSAKPSTGQFAERPLSGTTRVVEYSYRPNLSDEMNAMKGDKIVVKNEFDDGWAHGLNLSTKMEGYFPLEILEGYGKPGRKEQPSIYSHRASSMYISNTNQNNNNKDSMYQPNGTDSMYQPNGTDSMYQPNGTDSMYQPNNTDSMYQPNNTDSMYQPNNTDSMYFGNNNTDSVYQPGQTNSMYSVYEPGQTDSMYYGNNTDSVYQSNANTDSYFAQQGTTDSICNATNPNNNNNKKAAVKVVFDYNPVQNDELELRVGDSIDVTHEYDDGWGYGYNQQTSREGIFPLDCLAGFGAPTVEELKQTGSSGNSSKKHSQRMSSILMPELEKAFGGSGAKPAATAPYVPRPFGSSQQ
ncbi:hypothetical protein HDU78_010967 [Chytriomyces hyalinus]|nr:hypothetical protein HDU78_010967 [Chytriomyces hyalinus]